MNQDPRKAFEHHCKTIGIDGSALERWEEGCENPALAGQYMRNHVELMWRSYLWRTEVAAPQPNAALADGWVRKPLTPAQMEAGREAIFSTNNPFCPCDSKTFRKVAEWVERHHRIEPAPPTLNASKGRNDG